MDEVTSQVLLNSCKIYVLDLTPFHSIHTVGHLKAKSQAINWRFQLKFCYLLVEYKYKIDGLLFCLCG